MASFDIALNWILEFEDGPPPFRYKTVMDSNNAFVISGVNEASFPTQFAAINAIDQADRGPAVADFYRTQFWNPWGDQIALDDAAKRILDAAVNMGLHTAVRMAQLASGATVDGIIGPNTIAAINAAGSGFVSEFQNVRLGQYRQIVQSHPEDAVYLGTEANPGPWMRRAMA